MGSIMSSEKSVIVIPPAPKHLCPVCGKPAYSLGGVHPQCAIEQADQPRIVKLRAAKAAEPKTKKPVRQNWQKRCPECDAQSHISVKVCKCGHAFGGL
jgi:rRNA maturation endonuclease Nob1